MSIYALLEKDHRRVLELATALAALEEKDMRNCGLLIEQLRTEWIPSVRAEEAVFYNSLLRSAGLRDWIATGYQTHIVLESFLRLLQIQHKMTVAWKDTAETFRAGLEAHFKKEHDDLFPASRRLIRREEADMVGRAFERLKKASRGEISGGSGTPFTQSSLELAANLMPPRFATVLRSYNLEVHL